MTKILFSLGVVALFASCSSYSIPVDSFKKQFASIDKSSLQEVTLVYPSWRESRILINPIDSILCVDKKGNPKMLEKKASLEIKFIEKNNKKTIFYFDQVYMQDTLIIGNQSRFAVSQLIAGEKAISINNVLKIEIQDGHKKFQYK